MFDKIFKIFLLFIIVCSKEILVFNEEILIVLAFTLFIYLVSTKAGSLISQDLDSNIAEIKNKFLTYKNLREKSILHAINYIQRQYLLSSKIQNLIKVKNLYIKKILASHNINIKKYIFEYMEDILHRVALNERTKKIAFHKAYSSFVLNFVKIIKKTVFRYQIKKKVVK
jgi:hypothetical protein